MGRHSAPDSDEQELPDVDVRTTPVSSWGRHSGAEAEDTDAAPTERRPGSADAEPTVQTEAGGPAGATDAAGETGATGASGGTGGTGATGASGAGAVRKSVVDPHHGTRGDLHLLRESPTLRVRCAAAVLVPFVVYTVILVVMGRTDVYLIWLWIPTVLAGVLVGSFLDAAHRRLRIQAEIAGATRAVANPGSSGDDG